MNWKISGHHAIRIAERDGATLYKAADPVEGYRAGISAAEAREVVEEDPSLIYCIVEPTGWTGDPDGFQVCDYFRGSLNGHARSGATYLGPDDTGNEPTWRDAVPEVRANTRLIAAAPELLGALEALLFSTEALREELEASLGFCCEPASMKQARAAIAKAKGN